MNKNSAISIMILKAISEGKTQREAIDMVLGEGTFDRLVAELYDELRAS